MVETPIEDEHLPPQDIFYHISTIETLIERSRELKKAADGIDEKQGREKAEALLSWANTQLRLINAARVARNFLEDNTLIDSYPQQYADFSELTTHYSRINGVITALNRQLGIRQT